MNGYWPGRFAGRTVLITGAAGGLGAALADRLAEEGADVVRTDTTPPPSDRAMTLDVTSPDDWERVTGYVRSELGGLDGLALCHGVLGRNEPVTAMTPGTWEYVLSVNLTGAFLGIRAVLPLMVAAGYGRIVSISSVAGKEGNANQAAYSASKAGLMALTKSAAKECAGAGVTVNHVCPATFDTAMPKALDTEQLRGLLAKVPMARLGEPAEFASLAAWALSSEASFTTGACLDLSGGRSDY